MSRKKINLNREKLWKNPNNSFCLRFNDISIKAQCLLAKRIKEASPIKHTKSTTKGPTIEKIHEYLKEINPIIFAEGFSENPYIDRNEKRSFGIYNITSLTSERFRDLCSLIYQFSIKENLNKKTLKRCLKQTTRNFHKRREINEILTEIRNPSQEIQQKIIIKELDIKEIERVRLKNERYQNPNIFTPEYEPEYEPNYENT